MSAGHSVMKAMRQEPWGKSMRVGVSKKQRKEARKSVKEDKSGTKDGAIEAPFSKEEADEVVKAILHVSDDYHGCLEPMICGNSIVGHVPEVNGGTSIIMRASLTLDETLVLLTYWRRELASIYGIWADGCVGSTDMRMEPYVRNRVLELECMAASVIERLCDAEPRTNRTLRDLRDIISALDRCSNDCTTIPCPQSQRLVEACARMTAIPALAKRTQLTVADGKTHTQREDDDGNRK